MDFGRLVSGQDPNLTRQLAEQLMQNASFRDAAIKAAGESEDTEDTSSSSDSATQTQAPSALDNIINQLNNALTQAAEADDSPDAAPVDGEEDDCCAKLLQHPAVQQALEQVPLEQALGVKVLLGQISPEAAQQAVNLLNQLPSSTLNKVETVLGGLSAEDFDKGVNFFKALFSNRGDRGFFQQNNGDVYLNSQNAAQVTGADLNKFLVNAYYVLSSGYDVGDYLDHATNVLNKGDYDDFRRFLSVTDMVNFKGQDLDTYFKFGDKILEESPHDYEANLFQLYTTLAYGGSLEDYITIADNLSTSGQAGRNNMVDMTRITVDAYKSGVHMPSFFSALADEANAGGDLRATFDEYMTLRGMPPTGPDYSKFDRIERIDGEVMTIQEGESAALFAQAVSSRDGLLPESVLFWSSVETGAMSNGSSYLDLSTLEAGTYQIAVKIGNYSGGTDTAIKTVVVEPSESGPRIEDPVVDASTPAFTNPEIVLNQSGKLRIQAENGSAGLRSDLQLKTNNGELEKLLENAQNGGGFTTEKSYNAGDKLDLSIRTYNTYNDTTYDHGTDIGSFQGNPYVKVEQLSDTSWKLYFEDLEGDDADFDYDDVIVTVELIPDEAGSEEGEGAIGAVDGAAATGGGVADSPMSKAEATTATENALSALDDGDTSDGVVAALNERYYAALDAQIEHNHNYRDRIHDARNDAHALSALLDQVLADLRGEVAESESTSNAGNSNVNASSTGQTNGNADAHANNNANASNEAGSANGQGNAQNNGNVNANNNANGNGNNDQADPGDGRNNVFTYNPYF